ncbi:hypothetical protein PAPYR_1240 [Paratrimastix pyriformis]|uniref:Uncharacterized protein n=1 Tax=Paratrimastix pyriformis TaxID=342808 RepID=A0ABQ8USG1_9EUKA|nr:hypothetical protein PAPYR_1240 [Paratrimastix pyriformis]
MHQSQGIRAGTPIHDLRMHVYISICKWLEIGRLAADQSFVIQFRLFGQTKVTHDLSVHGPTDSAASESVFFEAKFPGVWLEDDIVQHLKGDTFRVDILEAAGTTRAPKGGWQSNTFEALFLPTRDGAPLSIANFNQTRMLTAALSAYPAAPPAGAQSLSASRLAASFRSLGAATTAPAPAPGTPAGAPSVMLSMSLVTFTGLQQATPLHPPPPRRLMATAQQQRPAAPPVPAARAASAGEPGQEQGQGLSLSALSLASSAASTRPHPQAPAAPQEPTASAHSVSSSSSPPAGRPPRLLVSTPFLGPPPPMRGAGGEGLTYLHSTPAPPPSALPPSRLAQPQLPPPASAAPPSAPHPTPAPSQSQPAGALPSGSASAASGSTAPSGAGILVEEVPASPGAAGADAEGSPGTALLAGGADSPLLSARDIPEGAEAPPAPPQLELEGHPPASPPPPAPEENGSTGSPPATPTTGMEQQTGAKGDGDANGDGDGEGLGLLEESGDALGGSAAPLSPPPSGRSGHSSADRTAPTGAATATSPTQGTADGGGAESLVSTSASPTSTSASQPTASGPSASRRSSCGGASSRHHRHHRTHGSSESSAPSQPPRRPRSPTPPGSTTTTTTTTVAASTTPAHARAHVHVHAHAHPEAAEAAVQTTVLVPPPTTEAVPAPAPATAAGVVVALPPAALADDARAPTEPPAPPGRPEFIEGRPEGAAIELTEDGPPPWLPQAKRKKVGWLRLQGGFSRTAVDPLGMTLTGPLNKRYAHIGPRVYSFLSSGPAALGAPADFGAEDTSGAPEPQPPAPPQPQQPLAAERPPAPRPRSALRRGPIPPTPLPPPPPPPQAAQAYPQQTGMGEMPLMAMASAVPAAPPRWAATSIGMPTVPPQGGCWQGPTAGFPAPPGPAALPPPAVPALLEAPPARPDPRALTRSLGDLYKTQIEKLYTYLHSPAAPTAPSSAPPLGRPAAAAGPGVTWGPGTGAPVEALPSGWAAGTMPPAGSAPPPARPSMVMAAPSAAWAAAAGAPATQSLGFGAPQLSSGAGLRPAPGSPPPGRAPVPSEVIARQLATSPAQAWAQARVGMHFQSGSRGAGAPAPAPPRAPQRRAVDEHLEEMRASQWAASMHFLKREAEERQPTRRPLLQLEYPTSDFASSNVVQCDARPFKSYAHYLHNQRDLDTPIPSPALPPEQVGMPPDPFARFGAAGGNGYAVANAQVREMMQKMWPEQPRPDEILRRRSFIRS